MLFKKNIIYLYLFDCTWQVFSCVQALVADCPDQQLNPGLWILMRLNHWTAREVPWAVLGSHQSWALYLVQLLMNLKKKISNKVGLDFPQIIIFNSLKCMFY